MNIDDFEITSGCNLHQNASIEKNEKTLDYTSSRKLSYVDIISLTKGLDVISEFFDVNSVAVVNGNRIASVALGKSLSEAVMSAIDSSPIDFIESNIVVSSEVDSDIARMLKSSNIIVAPSYTKNAVDYLESHNICYVTINTPLKDYKKFLSNDIKNTPLGKLEQAPNLSELDKEKFKVLSKTKPTVEQIEDAVFAWKIAKHANSQAVVISKDFKTSAIMQGMTSSTIELALDYSCERAKEGILASDMPLSLHDVNAALQCRISLIIVPSASAEIVKVVDKYNMALITTGITNISV